MKSLSNSIYDFSPRFIQICLLNIFAYRIHRQRFGAKLERLLRWFEETAKWSEAELIAYQEERLRYIVDHAYETVPFYSRKLKSLRLSPGDIKSIVDLSKLPIVTKKEIKENPESFISSKFRKRQLHHGHTSGTTGSPLDLYWDLDMVVMNNAVDWRQKNWAGFSLRDPHAVILGRVVVPMQQSKPPFWRMNYIHNQLWLSAFHMTDGNMEHYVKKLREFKPKFLEGYPSTLYILASYLVRKGEELQLEAVFSSSETLFPHQQEVIENVFSCKMFDFYGMAERVVFATECEFHSGKHLNMEYGITEVVDDTGLPVPMDTTGKIVGTSLHNLGMPLLRYQTNDVSTIRKERCECGRSHPLMDSITTKYEDIIVTPDGKWISPSVLTHPFKPQKNIIESQIVQKKNDLIQINIVKNKFFSSDDEKMLFLGLRERLGQDVKLHFNYVNEIPREKSGKFRWVISMVNKTTTSR